MTSSTGYLDTANLKSYAKPALRIALLVVAMVWAAVAFASGSGTGWVAGTVVTEAEMATLRADSCFIPLAIDAATAARMQGKSYRANPHVKLTDLRYVRVLHYGFDGKVHRGELVCNRRIASDLCAVMRELYEARYEIERMVLIDEYDADDDASMSANNTSCFCYRKTPGGRKLSNHALGLAIDLNPRYNPFCWRDRKGNRRVQPDNGRDYADRSKRFAHKIDRTDPAYRIFIKHGFTWGGAWRSSKDYQHFEKR